MCQFSCLKEMENKAKERARDRGGSVHTHPPPPLNCSEKIKLFTALGLAGCGG